jgi:primosomal protein N' (replication factor Y)
MCQTTELLLRAPTVNSLSMKAEAQRFARVVIPSPLKHPLTYSVPLPFRETISVGMRVLVPVGKRKLTGVVFELLGKSSRSETKEIIALCDDRPVLDPALLRLCQWIAQYYLATTGEVLATVLPPNLRTESQRIIIAKSGSSYRGDGLEYEILELLRQNSGRVAVKTMTRKLSGGSNVYHALAKLESIGAIEIREQLTGQRRRKKILLDDKSGS